MECLGLIVSRMAGEALNQIDASALIFLTIANLAQLAIILGLVIVAPVWIIRHCSARRDKSVRSGNQERETLERLENIADRIGGRLAAGEKILDADNPSLRERV